METGNEASSEGQWNLTALYMYVYITCSTYDVRPGKCEVVKFSMEMH